MILVVGATGLLGTEICRRLAKTGKSVRGLVRPTADPQKVGLLKSIGVSLVQGDLKDRPSLDAACRGAAAVITTASSTISRQPGDTIKTVDSDGQRHLVDAAKAAKVRHFVYISYSLEAPCALTTAKRSVELHLMESSLNYTILQPTAFMEVWLSPILGFDFVNKKAQIFGSGQKPVSWISFTDVAQFAVDSLENHVALNSTIKLGGPEALSPLEVIRIFEDVGNSRFDVQYVSEEALAAQKGGATDPLQESFAALMLSVAQGDVIDMRPTLKALPISLSSVSNYARHVMAV